jgi:hypothetical protein
MPQPGVSEAPLQHGLYALVREMYPDRHAALETHIEAMGRARFYLYLREQVTRSAEGWVRSMGSANIVEIFSQNTDVLRREGFTPSLGEADQVSLASFIWQTTLLGEARGDFYALTDYSYLTYLFSLESLADDRSPLRHDEILVASMKALLREDLGGGEVRRLFAQLDGYTLKPTHSYDPGCSLLTKLTTEMLWGGVRLSLKLPYTQFMPDLPRLLLLAREGTTRPERRAGR